MTSMIYCTVSGMDYPPWNIGDKVAIRIGDEPIRTFFVCEMTSTVPHEKQDTGPDGDGYVTIIAHWEKATYRYGLEPLSK